MDEGTLNQAVAQPPIERFSVEKFRVPSATRGTVGGTILPAIARFFAVRRAAQFLAVYVVGGSITLGHVLQPVPHALGYAFRYAKRDEPALLRILLGDVDDAKFP